MSEIKLEWFVDITNTDGGTITAKEQYEDFLANYIPQTPILDKTDILQQEVDQLKQINAGLLFDSASSKIEMDKQKQTDANMLLEIALLKGGL